MKKTKLLTSLVALALVVGLGACETGDIIVNVGDVDIGGDGSDTTDTEPSEPSSSDTGSTPSEPEEDSSSSSSTPTEPPVVTHEYSIEVENADALKELTYDGNAATQQGIQLSIYLVDTPSEGTPTKEAATENDITFTVSDPTVVTVSGLTVLPLKEGSTSITIAWASNATTSVDVLVTDITVNEPEGPTSWADYFTDEYTQGVLNELFDGVALDDILPFYLEESGLQRCEPQPTLLRFNIEYYPEPSGLTETWVALLLEDGWTETSDESSNQGTTETISFEKDGYTISIVIEWGYWDLYLYPRTTTGGDGDGEDLETAQAILNAVQGSTPNWTAFYADVTKDDDDAYTEYLTTDDDGNLYGYRYDWDDWEEEGSEFWYYGGYKCKYSYDGSIAQTPGEVYTTFEDELEALTYSLTISFDLASDPYTLTEVDDGYELTVAKSTTYYNTYTFIVDASYNLLAIDTDAQIGSQSDEIALGHVEGISYEDVEAFIATTNFNPADFGFGEGGDEGTGLTLADYIVALNDKGFNYGDGFYFSQQSLEMDSNVEVLEVYYSLEIEALSNDVGYASQGHYDAGTGYYASEFYSDGTTTYTYESDGQTVADAGGLYCYWYYQYTLESYFEFDTITEQLNSLGEDADLTDSDNVITNDYLYLCAYASDYSAMVELFAAYDENGITYLVYSYGTETSSYAVVFYPTDTVTTPEWYVPDTGTGEENPLAALAGTYTGTTAGSNSMRLLLNEDGTGIYDYEGTSPRDITYTLDGNTVKFELDGDDVVLTWDAEAGTLIGIYYQDYGEYEIAVNLSKDADVEEDNPLAAVAGSYTGTSNAGASLTLELYEDGTGLYDGNTAITWTFDGTNVHFEINYGDPVNLVWDAEAQTLIGTWYQDYEYEIYLSFTKVESGNDDTQEEVTNLVGTWTGQGTYSNTYTVTIYTDGTYKLVLPAAEYTGTWTGSLDGTIELDVSSTVFEYFKLTYDASSDTAKIEFEDDDCSDYTFTYTRVG